MSNEQRSSQSFCGRPGCGIAKALHGYSAAACSNFIQPGSKEANALRRELPTAVGADPIDSSLLDRVLMAGALEHLQVRIRQAMTLLQVGLGCDAIGDRKAARRAFEASLKALGSLGAS